MKLQSTTQGIQVTPDELHEATQQLEQLERDVDAWIAGANPILNFRTIDALCDARVHSAEIIPLGRRAHLLELKVVAHGMHTYVPFPDDEQYGIAHAILEGPYRLDLANNPETTYALLHCMLSATRFGLSPQGCVEYTAFLHQWLPNTIGKTLPPFATPNQLADMVFDPVWRCLYAIDFDALEESEQSAVLLSHPPLNQSSPAAQVPSTSLVLPTDISVDIIHPTLD